MLPFVRLWIWVSAFASLAGWGLSAAGELNRQGYAVAFAVFAIFILVFRKGLSEKSTVHSPQRRAFNSQFGPGLWTVDCGPKPCAVSAGLCRWDSPRWRF